MSIENKFIPIAEANTRFVRTDLSLPFNQEEKIGLNIQRLHALMQIGGACSLKIINDSTNETSSVQSSVLGFDTQGNAFAGKSKMNNVPISSSEMRDQYDWYIEKQARWINLDIKINTEEIKQRLLQSGKIVTEPKNWSISIDQSLKRQIAKNCGEHLIGHFNIKDKLYTGFLLSMCSLPLLITDFPNSRSLTTYLSFFIRQSMIWTVFDSLRYGVEKSHQGRRASIFYGFEFDRLALLYLLTNTSTLAKNLEGLICYNTF